MFDDHHDPALPTAAEELSSPVAKRLPSMADLDGLEAELDWVDRTLAELDS